MSGISKHYLTIILLTIISSLLFWLVFYFNLPQHVGFPQVSLETIYSNYDGPNYMVISRCWYDNSCIRSNFSLPLPLEYYPAHLPGYPLLLAALSIFTTLPKAMLVATLLGSVFLSVFSYRLFALYLSSKNSYWLTVLLLFFPARLFVLRQIGAPETWFIASIVASLYYFKTKKYFWSAIFASFAQITKTPGALLALSFLILAVYEIFKYKNLSGVIKKYYPYLLVPLSLLLVFYFYYLKTGNFYAYFQSGDNIHLYPFPYAVFISNLSWIGTIWLEEIIYILLLAFLGIKFLLKKYKFDILSIFPLIFTLAAVCVGHRDISRYISPVYPFMFLAFQRFLNKKTFRIIILLLLPAIVLYGVNFVIGNTTPIADWSPYLN
ncbi:MAG: hypothetical protein ACOX6N_03565 [Patescibacteria group bacterium]|jgi:hypothetical protein